MPFEKIRLLLARVISQGRETHAEEFAGPREAKRAVSCLYTFGVLHGLRVGEI
jgi:hypothetical protein